MSHKKKIITIFSVTFITLCVSIIISELDFTYCNSQDYCDDAIWEAFGQGVGLLSLSVLPSLILLFFTKEKVYKTWKKFAFIFLFIAFIWILIVPSSSGGSFKISLDHKESASMIFSIAFFFISLLIIIIQSIKLAGKAETEKEEVEQK